MSQLPISPQVFSILSALIAEKTGLHFAATDSGLFADKISTRALDAGFESLLDYYYFLRYDDGGAVELDQLIDALVVGETYLFRELDQLEVMVSDFLAPLVAAGRRPRVWSAACATGEEPHTIAMLLADRGLLERVDIVASDISPKALARARAGDFTRRALRREPPAFALPWVELQGDRVMVKASLRAAIEWRRINLIDAAAVAALGTFDVVVCRNVLIYFDDPTARRVIDSLGAALTPAGALFVGVSESLLRFGTSLDCQEQRGVFFYRKPA
jgi:chemotaxis protein methyltransferase CheR